MTNKRIVLVARDAAPSRAFSKLGPVLEESGFVVQLFANDGKPLVETEAEVLSAVTQANFVLLGMSSSKELAKVEIMAGEKANALGITYGFYGDIRRCWARARPGAWFERLASNAKFYLGITQEDAGAAVNVFPNASCFVTGNPLREEMAFPRFTREEVRTKLNINPREKLVLAPGNKFAAGNFTSWTTIMEALSLLTKKNQYYYFQLILATHPGDRTPFAIDSTTQKELKLYEELIKFSPVPARLVGKEVLTTSDMVPGADIIVEFGSSIGIEGAYQNVPVISLGFEVLFRRFEQVGGTRMLESVEDGISELVVGNVAHLADRISTLLTPVGFSQMRANQERMCPKPIKRDSALCSIANVIAQII